MGKTYRSAQSSRYYDGYQEGGKRKDKSKVKKIKSSLATKKVDKRDEYGIKNDAKPGSYVDKYD